MVDVDIEDSFEPSGPTHARRRTLRLRVIACGLGCLLYRPGMISLRNFAFGASTPWKRIRCKRGRGTRAGEALHELQRRHDDMGGAVVEHALQFQHDIPGAITLEPFVGDRRAGDIPA